MRPRLSPSATVPVDPPFPYAAPAGGTGSVPPLCPAASGRTLAQLSPQRKTAAVPSHEPGPETLSAPRVRATGSCLERLISGAPSHGTGPRLALLLLSLASPALAQTPMSPAEFEAWSTGKTLSYSIGGDILGSEAYFPGRTVRDADTGGPCIDGTWHAQGDAVCFVYPARDGVHCWTYWRDGAAVFAKPLAAAPEDPPQRVTEAASPLTCPAPGVGV